MADLIDYEELVSKNNIFLDNLMFGNGFSIYFGSRFRYNNLFDEAKQLFEEYDEQLFSVFETSNFETVLRSLHTSKETNKIFGIDSVLLDESYERIKQSLIETVKKVHPEANEMTLMQINHLKTTFNMFKKKVFTTNYDLLAYWALNKIRSNSRKVSDGFGWDTDTDTIMFGAGVGVSEDDNPLRLYYLHGSLHLYMDDGEIIKITRARNPVGTTDNTLLTTITDSYDEGYLPLYVSEGTWKQKKAKINNNKYLRHCYDALLKTTGGLTIFGQSLDADCDKHLIDAIKQSNIKKIAYGIYDIKRQALIEKEISSAFHDCDVEVEFYDSRNFFECLSSLEWDKFSGL